MLIIATDISFRDYDTIGLRLFNHHHSVSAAFVEVKQKTQKRRRQKKERKSQNENNVWLRMDFEIYLTKAEKWEWMAFGEQCIPF